MGQNGLSGKHSHGPRHERETRGARPAWRLALGLAALALMAWPGAASSGPYDVEAISVQASAADAVIAKEAAIADGRVRALAIVLQRLTRAIDREFLPQIPAARLEEMIVNFRVLGEQTTSTDYFATLTIHFDPAEVQNFLGVSGIPYADQQAPPVLVVPVYRNGKEVFFFDNNPHLEAWRTFDLVNTLTPVKLPDGNIAARGVDPDAVLSHDIDALVALGYLYGTQSVLISLCETDAAQSGFTCSLDGTGPGGPVALTETFAGGSDPLAVAQAAVGSFLAQIEEQWKVYSTAPPVSPFGAEAGLPASPLGAEASLPGGPFGVVEALPFRLSVSFAGLREWQTLRMRLSNLPGVTDLQIEALAARGAKVSLHYAGTNEELVSVLASAGMELADAGDHFILKSY